MSAKHRAPVSWAQVAETGVNGLWALFTGPHWKLVNLQLLNIFTSHLVFLSGLTVFYKYFCSNGIFFVTVTFHCQIKLAFGITSINLKLVKVGKAVKDFCFIVVFLCLLLWTLCSIFYFYHVFGLSESRMTSNFVCGMEDALFLFIPHPAASIPGSIIPGSSSPPGECTLNYSNTLYFIFVLGIR